jgi:hypothetical protein
VTAAHGNQRHDCTCVHARELRHHPPVPPQKNIPARPACHQQPEPPEREARRHERRRLIHAERSMARLEHHWQLVQAAVAAGPKRILQRPQRPELGVFFPDGAQVGGHGLAVRARVLAHEEERQDCALRVAVGEGEQTASCPVPDAGCADILGKGRVEG